LLRLKNSCEIRTKRIKILTIKTIDQGFYHVEENLWAWAEDMFEGLAEDTIQPVILKNIIFSNENYIDKVELCLGDNYEIVVEGDKTFVQRKKPKYPMTYEECCKVLGISRHDVEIDLPYPYQQNMFNLFKLLICRDAYWKIAGDWKPDWTNEKETKYTINHTKKNDIIFINVTYSQYVLSFPTAEMRDAFYKNFKDLIKSCKELL
jgi:hypothetical protein